MWFLVLLQCVIREVLFIFGKHHSVDLAVAAFADCATAKAVTAWRRQRRARVNTLLCWCAFIRIVFGTGEVDATIRLRSFISFATVHERFEKAADVKVTTIVAAAAVPIKEAILFDSVDVVAGNVGRKAAFIVVVKAGALGVRSIDDSIVVVVNTSSS